MQTFFRILALDHLFIFELGVVVASSVSLRKHGCYIALVKMMRQRMGWSSLLSLQIVGKPVVTEVEVDCVYLQTFAQEILEANIRQACRAEVSSILRSPPFQLSKTRFNIWVFHRNARDSKPSQFGVGHYEKSQVMY